MIKNGHHHNHHQVNTAAGKDAGTTPGATACSPEKRRRRIRVWCDGWWVLKCVMKIPRHCGYAHSLHRARFIGCGSVIPAAGQACCRLQDAHSAAASFFTGISMHTTSWVGMLLKVYTLLSVNHVIMPSFSALLSKDIIRTSVQMWSLQLPLLITI